MRNAPVTLFVYNRPDHARRVIEALEQNDQAGDTELFIFADGPRLNASPDDLKKINSVRSIVSEVKGFKKVHLDFAAANKGLATSLIQGISKVLENADEIIVVEDDILCSRYFLTYCNAALEKYADDEHVMGISGFSFPLKLKDNRSYFIRTGPCWGWATWARAWKHFNSNATALLNEITSKRLQYQFDFSDSYYYTEMLKQQAEGKINSWAICWYASIFLNDGVTLFPAKSLTKNIGMDGSGTNYTVEQQISKQTNEFSEDVKDWIFPDETFRNMKAHEKIERYFQQELKQGVRDVIKKTFKKIFS